MLIKPFVYVASPYTKGDPCINANFQCRIFNEMMDDGIVIPYIPLWSHFQHSVLPRPYKDWIEYDNTIIPRIDALVRLNATFEPMKYEIKESSGADNEVALAKVHNKPVFFCLETLYQWARNSVI